MKKLILLALTITVLSCSTEENREDSCNCIAIREQRFSTDGINYGSWQQIALYPTTYTCDQNGYIFSQDGYAYNGLFYKERTRVECK